MVDTVSLARTGYRQGAYPAATDPPGAGQERGAPVGARTREPARENGMSRALDQTERAARLLERAFVGAVEQEELYMPALERLYAALQETEAAAVAIDRGLSRTRHHDARDDHPR